MGFKAIRERWNINNNVLKGLIAKMRKMFKNVKVKHGLNKPIR